MSELANRDIHYAFFVCVGKFNMDLEEASACAELVQARHSMPYHMAPGQLFLIESGRRYLMAQRS